MFVFVLGPGRDTNFSWDYLFRQLSPGAPVSIIITISIMLLSCILSILTRQDYRFNRTFHNCIILSQLFSR
jgi:hypothetical protein